MVHVAADLQPPQAAPWPADTDPEKRSAWFEQWKQTEAGKTYLKARDEYEQVRAACPDYCASADRDGSVRIDDMAAGDYTLDVWFTGENDPPNINGRISYKFTVPPMPSGRSNEVLDIGTITLLATKQ